ncbi:class I SAM-dependent methyltransferase [Roseomonas sp. NAR14]|uniref:Class I SAM-dependent methyltransferase n=1 Tax=Roseomonas acroporae TaxID=2937791 RepID=A0A9X2BYM5_9PROT|nr:class I SAM-dependent methyltransferase [Roseomonas acroporae]
MREQGEAGDYGRRCVLDAPMLGRIARLSVADALDVGCGEGRFCRMLRARGIRAVGIDPTEALLRRARALDPGGDYRHGRAEALDVPPASFDLVVSYLSLIDIDGLAPAVAGMAAALRPGGTLLIANLNPFFTAGMPQGWQQAGPGEPRFHLDHYLEERAYQAEWRGIRIRNWHRPLSTYMRLLLGNGLELRHFDEPAPVCGARDGLVDGPVDGPVDGQAGGDPARAERYRRVPWFHLMEWRRPAAAPSDIEPSGATPVAPPP